MTVSNERPLEVVYEDDEMLVIDKPAGLVCHPTKNGEWSSVIGRVRLHLGHGGGRLVNRLDRETSGLMIVAKGADAARELGGLLSRGEIAKRYFAIVHGHLQSDDLAIVAPLGKDTGSAVAIKDAVREDGSPAETRVEVVQRFWRDARPFTAVDVFPVTGRKHQIRIHLAHVGHPIVGDKIYGADEDIYLRLVSGTLTEADRVALLLPHHALHAGRLEFAWRGGRREFEAPAPSGIQGFFGGGEIRGFLA